MFTGAPVAAEPSSASPSNTVAEAPGAAEGMLICLCEAPEAAGASDPAGAPVAACVVVSLNGTDLNFDL